MKKVLAIAAIVAMAIVAARGISLAVDKGVTWNPAPVRAVAVWGKTTTSSVSFVSDKNLNKVDVRIDPALQPYLTVTPSSLGKISKDQLVTLTLAFTSASNTPPQVVSGTITLFKDNGAAKVFSALPVSVSIEPVTLPPDPGEQGKQTLEGIDSDHDQIRDDIERYIALTYWDMPGIAAGLRQYAKPLQEAIVDSDDKDKALAHTNDIGRAFGCIEIRSEGQNDIEKIKKMDQLTDDLLVRTLNTDQRSRAYIAYDSQLGGHTFPGLPFSDQSTCDISN